MKKKIRFFDILITLIWVLTAVFILGLTIRPLAEHGIFSDITVGKYIIQNMSIPGQDIFSYASQNKTWINENWLYQCVVYLLFSVIGIKGLIVLKGLILTGVFLLYVKLAKERCWSVELTSIIFAVSFFLFREKWLLRSQTLGIVLFLVQWYMIVSYSSTRNTKYLKLFPFLMLLWANVHSSFIVGVVVLIVFFLTNLLKKYSRQRYALWYGRTFTWKTLIKIFNSVLISSVIVLVNPSGKALVAYAVRSVSIPALYCVMDWVSFERVFFMTIPYLILPVITILSMFFVPVRKKDIIDIVMLVFIVIVGYVNKRFSVFPFMLAIPIAIKYLSGIASMIRYELKFERVSYRKHVLSIYLSCCIFVILFLTAKVVYANPHDFFNPSDKSGFYPDNAISFIKNKGLEPNIYAPFYYNGYLLYKLYPDYLQFIDYRSVYIDPWSVLEDLKIREADLGWEFTADKYAVNTVLLPYQPGETFFLNSQNRLREKLAQAPEWRLIYFDDNDLIYVRRPYHLDNYDKENLYLTVDPENFTRIAFADSLTLNEFEKEYTHRNQQAPQSAWCNVALSAVAARKSNMAEARKYLNNALKIKSNDQNILLYDSVFRAFEQGDTKPVLYLTSLKDKMRTASVMLVFGFYELAEKYLEDILSSKKMFPYDESYSIFLLLGICRNKLDKYNEALEVFKKAYNIRPNDALSLYYMSCCYIDNKIYDQASFVLREAIAKDQNNYLYWYELAKVFLKRGNIEDAIRMCRKSLKLRPHHFDSWLLANRLYRQVGKYKRAFEVVDNAVIINPFSEKAQLALASTYMDIEKYDKAQTSLMKVKDPYFDTNADYFLAKARLSAVRNKPGEAFDLLKKAIELGGTDTLYLARQANEFKPLLDQDRFKKLLTD